MTDRDLAVGMPTVQPFERAITEIAQERVRQVTVEGWTPEHDDRHEYGELAHAAAAYASHTDHREQVDIFAQKIGGGKCRVGWFLPHNVLWPWDPAWWKPTTKRRNLIKAAALIVAEIERLDRAAARDARRGEGEVGDV